ncbi:hypothetical protein BATDEDRAFT_27323 [Batrachochytrium dendrobatidis JAM81]|uniref:Cyclin N-terminal domain-containing protein n=1 Tax=Batrachochytrium dendrobatidis (strain JAM81 / FGSC 10211) TaxID=684364 RepID=F4PAH9_BATDJ|nr:uncharacterized protein BATDEDRAFT_27323 [Batrachochytrium dendrobatidis JAM81]EGF77543.1 hypothetical protein BATDEDRAFT_27323 [Batrachochytrium dendrobatidis JAM81]|eukprot:XP_006681651.1 hypothetical protein BATDEDRAFT_27323 [Batrachochytrium dendrobatidis JAM81]
MDTHIKFMVDCSDLLLLPQPTLATAIIYHHKHSHYYSIHPTLSQMDSELLSATCLHLACKTTETPRKLRDIINVGYYISTKQSTGTPTALVLGETYWQLKDTMQKSEIILLRILSFNTMIHLPYQYIPAVIYSIRGHASQPYLRRIAQSAFILVNDLVASFGTWMKIESRCGEYTAVTVALAAVYINLASVESMPMLDLKQVCRGFIREAHMHWVKGNLCNVDLNYRQVLIQE